MLIKCSHLKFESARKRFVVIIQKRNIFPFCMNKPHVSCGGCAPTELVLYVNDSGIMERLNCVGRSFFSAVVNNDNLKILERLFQN